MSILEEITTTIMVRQLRLAAITNVYAQGRITEESARELLRGPLDPDDPATTCDDSDLFGRGSKALEEIAIRTAVAKEREACAQLSENTVLRFGLRPEAVWAIIAYRNAIRARGQVAG